LVCVKKILKKSAFPRPCQIDTGKAQTCMQTQTQSQTVSSIKTQNASIQLTHNNPEDKAHEARVNPQTPPEGTSSAPPKLSQITQTRLSPSPHATWHHHSPKKTFLTVNQSTCHHPTSPLNCGTPSAPFTPNTSTTVGPTPLGPLKPTHSKIIFLKKTFLAAS
jgi:hypothetical protein